MKRAIQSIVGRLLAEAGITTVLFALMLPAIVAMQALTIDAAEAFVARRELQNAADAAALAAAAYLPSTDPQVLAAATQAAIDFAARNDIDLSPQDVVFSTKRQAYDVVSVRTNQEVTFFFAQALGVTFSAVGSNGDAQLGSVAGALGVMPWGVEEPPTGFRYGELYCLKLGSGGPQQGACPAFGRTGDFAAIDIDNLGNDSAEVYEGLIVSGSHTDVRVGQVKNISAGNKQGPTFRGTGCGGTGGRISGDTSTFEQVVVRDVNGYRVLDWSNPRLVLIPAIVKLNVNAVEVVGFTVFFIEDCNSNGSVIGRFIDTVVPGGVWMPWTDGFGSKSVRLIK